MATSASGAPGGGRHVAVPDERAADAEQVGGRAGLHLMELVEKPSALPRVPRELNGSRAGGQRAAERVEGDHACSFDIHG
jgi:hypothetical protein